MSNNDMERASLVSTVLFIQRKWISVGKGVLKMRGSQKRTEKGREWKKEGKI
jgi:hypothetical protein